jgi:DNA-binding transcriptional MerR regulator
MAARRAGTGAPLVVLFRVASSGDTVHCPTMKNRRSTVLAAKRNAPKKPAQNDAPADVASHLLTRVQVARACDVSLSLVRKWEREAVLPVHVLPDGVHVFDRRDVELLRVQRAKKNGVKAAHTSGELAAHVFAQLEAGEQPIAIVTALRVHPDVVEHASSQWARMRGAVLVNVAQLDELLQLVPVDARRARPADAAQLVVAMKSAVESAHPCVRCRDATARFCAECVATTSQRASQASQARRR